MEVVKDITFENDLLIANGDFVLTESDESHIQAILEANKGYFFETPLLGLGIIEQLKGSGNQQEVKQDVRRQLTLDNFSVQIVEVVDSNLSINAKRLT